MLSKKDKIVCICGIIILIVASVAIFSYESPSKPSPKLEKTYSISWNEKSVAKTIENWTKDGETTSITKKINEKNLTAIKFKLSWEDDHPGVFFNRSDILKMKITPPDGTDAKFYPSESESDWEGPIIITAKLGEMPKDATINATSMDELNSTLEKYEKENGIGDWIIEITVDAKPWLLDRGNDWKLEISYSYYEAIVREMT
jgi:hypothetical protein